jgi:hypothetical protein
MYQFLKIHYAVKSKQTKNGSISKETSVKQIDNGELAGTGTITCVVYKTKPIDIENSGVCRQELLSRKNNPTVTLKFCSVHFNIHAVRMLDECGHIKIMIHREKKILIAKPCDKNDIDALQWSRLSKCGKVEPKKISGVFLGEKLYYEMNWSMEDTVKIHGDISETQDEKILVFKLNDNEI